jgi:hypothetical protein
MNEHEQAYWKGHTVGAWMVIVGLVELFSPPLTTEHLQMQLAAWMEQAEKNMGRKAFIDLYREIQKLLREKEPEFLERWNKIVKGVQPKQE